ncbi:Tn3 family transposase [Bacillus sp. UNC322MFChir4.1]|uniref:Tn3 family transposase n=1 Tax=Bacillus sp. UNC322MFChir4.1 TaxID=1449045 RepID=UPI00054F0933|nr:Tn3 family transposase [Bacillus sp. UNC322MFChir4.1]
MKNRKQVPLTISTNSDQYLQEQFQLMEEQLSKVNYLIQNQLLTDVAMDIPDEYLQHISPLGWEHITLTGDYVWNLNQKTNFNNLRPLRDKVKLPSVGVFFIPH